MLSCVRVPSLFGAPYAVLNTHVDLESACASSPMQIVVVIGVCVCVCVCVCVRDVHRRLASEDPVVCRE